MAVARPAFGGRYGHTRDLVISFEIVLPTGERIRVGDGGGSKVRKSSSGYQLKHLFMGHQGTLGIATKATLKLFPKPEAELSPFWAFDDYDDAISIANDTLYGLGGEDLLDGGSWGPSQFDVCFGGDGTDKARRCEEVLGVP